MSTTALNDSRNKLLNLSILSAESKDYIIVQRKSSIEPLRIRPTIHLFQITPFGETKTTLADRIKEYCLSRNHPYLKVNGVTAPAIAGSVDEKYRAIPPLCTEFLNGTIIIDEFNTNPIDKSNAIGSALDVLESEESNRVMARMPKKPAKSNPTSKIQYEICNGRIRFSGLRASWIFLSAKYLQMNRSLPLEMLISRTVPVWFMPTWEDLDAIDDNPNLLFKPLNLVLPKFETIPNSTYLEIRNYVKKSLKANSVPQNYYFRTVCDCVRSYVFNSYQHDFEMYDFILKQKNMFASRVDLAELEMLVESSRNEKN